MDKENNKIKNINKASGVGILVTTSIVVYALISAGSESGMVVMFYMFFLLPILMISIAVYLVTYFKLDKILKRTDVHKSTKINFSGIIRAIILGIAISLTFLIAFIVIGNIIEK